MERRPDGIPDARYPEKVERRSDRISDVRYSEKVERRPNIISDVRCPGGMSVGKSSGCDISWWNVGGKRNPDAICPGEMEVEEFRMRCVRME